MLTWLISILVGKYVIVNNYQAFGTTHQYELPTFCYFVVAKMDSFKMKRFGETDVCFSDLSRLSFH